MNGHRRRKGPSLQAEAFDQIVAIHAPPPWSTGTGSEIMRRIAAPMVGGMVTAPLPSMLVLPAAYLSL
jgi:Cu/Ag efflux pump CusA